jgi:hypothetical protein
MRNSAFWRDPVSTLNALQDIESIPEYLKDVQAIVSTLQQAKSQATHNAPALDYAIFAGKRAAYLGESLASAQAMQKFNPYPMRNLLKKVSDLKTEYAELWQRENQSWWLDRNLAKFDDLQARLKKLTN